MPAVPAVTVCWGAGVRAALGASLQVPEEFMYPSSLSVEQKDLSLTGTASEAAGSGVHGNAGAVSGCTVPMQMQPSED